jgi:hypothetical protein
MSCGRESARALPVFEMTGKRFKGVWLRGCFCV